MTANKPMTGEQLDELMTIAVNMQRDSEKLSDRPAAMFAYAVQVAVLELRKVRNEAAALAAENAGLKEYRPQPSGAAMMEALDAFYEYHEDVPEQGMMAAFEILCCKRPVIPATDAFLAEVRASAFNDLCAEFVKHKALAGLGDRQKVTVFEATEALLHCAEQLDTQFRKGVQS
ncbi:hypothetical protein [Enterobacter hormaechei]|uniref:hypothetical protein n=1 Tax=Enterobacter cloacae complex TaxID=354276 RepID=UPI0005F0AE1D|nr:hypothetical protein [Enterobacter hormaechei]HBY5489972.1 hypothetical protein [Klebsiella pneumoniae]KJO85056.1 hypothetical protein SR97_11650 [Enterobacter hormaechei subsp. xiangfangensis]KJP28357.1 hypothetical protein SR77_09280 [Enterobacter hormaechei subsp. xiangfangensis]MCE1319848.1 hypothetical protein [Enterobacter hormaechei]MCE1332508.1 hypothetical protein [Enterobacter hormaechei]